MAEATKNTSVAGSNDDTSAQVDAELKAREAEAKAAKDSDLYKADEKPSGKSVAEEFLEANPDTAQIGVDGKTPVTFFNPAPKAVSDPSRWPTRTDDAAERDVK